MNYSPCGRLITKIARFRGNKRISSLFPPLLPLPTLFFFCPVRDRPYALRVAAITGSDGKPRSTRRDGRQKPTRDPIFVASRCVCVRVALRCGAYRVVVISARRIHPSSSLLIPPHHSLSLLIYSSTLPALPSPTTSFLSPPPSLLVRKHLYSHSHSACASAVLYATAAASMQRPSRACTVRTALCVHCALRPVL